MYLTKLAQRTGEDSNAVTYSDLASVVQVLLIVQKLFISTNCVFIRKIPVKFSTYILITKKGYTFSSGFKAMSCVSLSTYMFLSS